MACVIGAFAAMVAIKHHTCRLPTQVGARCGSPCLRRAQTLWQPAAAWCRVRWCGEGAVCRGRPAQSHLFRGACRQRRRATAQFGPGSERWWWWYKTMRLWRTRDGTTNSSFSPSSPSGFMLMYAMDAVAILCTLVPRLTRNASCSTHRLPSLLCRLPLVLVVTQCHQYAAAADGWGGAAVQGRATTADWLCKIMACCGTPPQRCLLRLYR